MGVRVGVQAERADGGACLGAADGTLEVEQRTRFGFALLLAGDDLLDLGVVVSEAQFAGRVDVLQHDVVVYGHVARSFVGYVYVVSLLHEADKGTAHRDDVVVGVGREYHHALGERFRRYRACRIVGVGLAARPARDGVLEVVEDVDVDLVVGVALFEQFAQRVFDIILVGEFEDRLLYHAAQPYYGLARELGRPFAGAYQPRCLLARKHLRGIFVDHHLDIGVHLQV